LNYLRNIKILNQYWHVKLDHFVTTKRAMHLLTCLEPTLKNQLHKIEHCRQCIFWADWLALKQL